MVYYWPLSHLLFIIIASFSQWQFVVQGHLPSSSSVEEASVTEISSTNTDADSSSSAEIVDVLIVNPIFSSFNEQPKRVDGGVNRRELLLRKIRERKKPRQFFPSSPTSSLLTSQQTLRPYFLPVPKAKAIPGPILTKTGKDTALLKGTKLLAAARMDFVNSQSTAALGAEQGRIKLVNGGGDEQKNVKDGDEEDMRRTTATMPMHSNEVVGQNDDGRRQEGASTLIGGWSMKTRIRPKAKKQEDPSFSALMSLDEHAEQQQKSIDRISASSIQPAKIFGQTQKLSQPIFTKSQHQFAVDGKKSRIRQQRPTIPPTIGQHRRQLQSLVKSTPSPPLQFQFYFTPSQTSVNQDFTFATGSPGLVCAYGMPIPIYNTPRKQCIPYSPLCGLAFTCLMDVHAVDENGKIVENWWTIPDVIDQHNRQSNRGGIQAFGPIPPTGITNFGSFGGGGGFPTTINPNRGEWIG